MLLKLDNKTTNFRVIFWTATLLSTVILAVIAWVAIVSFQNTINPQGIVIHHSAVPFFDNGSPLDAKALDGIHERRGYRIFYWGQTYHVGYHYIILPDGTLETGRPEKSIGAHTKGFNDYTGICLIGDFSPTDNPFGEKGPQEPTPEQLETLVKITSKLQFKYKIPQEKIYLHKDLNLETECPGMNFPLYLTPSY